MTDDLEVCPFCGETPFDYAIAPHDHTAALKRLIPTLPDFPGAHCIECASCGIVLMRDTKTEAIDAWNKRK